jgi:hypothetical protein
LGCEKDICNAVDIVKKLLSVQVVRGTLTDKHKHMTGKHNALAITGKGRQVPYKHVKNMFAGWLVDGTSLTVRRHMSCR